MGAGGGGKEVNEDTGKVELKGVVQSFPALPLSLTNESVSTIRLNIQIWKLQSKTTRLIKARARARGAGKQLRGEHISSHLRASTRCRQIA